MPIVPPKPEPINPMVALGLGKIKKKPVKPPPKQTLEEAIAALSGDKTEEEGGGFQDYDIMSSLFLGLNPLAKFKKRRGKPDKTKQFSIGSFLEWFEGSQALERIITLEKYLATQSHISTSHFLQ